MDFQNRRKQLRLFAILRQISPSLVRNPSPISDGKESEEATPDFGGHTEFLWSRIDWWQVHGSELEEKKTALAQSKERLDELQIKLKEAENKVEEHHKELLIDKESSISAEVTSKCEELRKELKQKEQELELWQNAPVVIEQKLNQEDIVNAAGKLEECQKTIASLGSQLKSLASLEDFLIDPLPIVTNGGNEMWKLHSNNMYLPQKRCDDHFQDPEEGLHTFSKYVDREVVESSPYSSANMFSCSSEKRGNGCEKLFPMRKF